MSTSRTSPRTALPRALATLLAVVSPGLHAQADVANQISNGSFATNLSGWSQEGVDDLTSNWSSQDAAGSAASGSFRGEAKGGHTYPGSYDTHGTVGWQCLDVEPDRVYRLSMVAKGDSAGGSGARGALYARDITGQSCPTGTHTGDSVPSGAAFTSFRAFDPDWVQRSTDFRTAPGQTRIQAGLHVGKGEVNANGGYNANVWFDEVVVGKVRPDLEMRTSASDTTLEPRQTVTIDLELASLRPNGIGPTARIYHEDRLALVSHTCPGTLVDASQGGQHFFAWSAIGGDVEPYTRACRVTARARTGFAGNFTLRAEADCTECGIEAVRDNNVASIAMATLTAPDLSVQQVTLTDFPGAGEVVDLALTFRNLGTQFASGNVVINLTPATLALQPDEQSACALFTSPALGQVAGPIVLSGGETLSCTLRLAIAANQQAAPLSAIATVTTSGDYDSSNDSASDSTRIVRLRVNRAIDGYDRQPGDGICESQAGGKDCSLRAAVMEAVGLGGRRTIELPYSSFAYTLSRTSGDSDALKGDLDITAPLILRGEPDAGGVLPVVVGGFPTASMDRLFTVHTGSSASSTIIENVAFSGQNLPPAVSDGSNGNGGLGWHRSGALILRNVSLRNGRSNGAGGALFGAGSHDLTLDRVLAEDNQAATGGGVALAGSSFSLVQVRSSRFTGNLATTGGGLSNRLTAALVALDSSTFDDNDADVGGGIELSDALLTRLVNSTVSGNRAATAGGGIAVVRSALPVVHSTIALNAAAPQDPDAGTAGGILVQDADVHLYGSILSSNTARRHCSAPNPPFPSICLPLSANCSGAISSDGYNAAAPDADCAIPQNTGDYSGNVSLAPLADNGGPVPTHAPASVAQIVDAAAPSCTAGPGGSALRVDQRGALRPTDGDADGSAACDRGAFELTDSARISVAVTGAGAGRVASNPSGITCGDGTANQCEGIFALEAEVTLTASASAGNRFVGWSGDCAGFGQAACTLGASGDLQAEAEFAPLSNARQLSVNVVSGGNGSSGRVQSTPSGIDCPGACAADFPLDTVVTLAATPDANAAFLGFYGAGCNGGTGSCPVTMGSDREVDAVFDAEASSITVLLTGDGVGQVLSAPAGINCPGTCSADFSVFDAVELQPQAAVGSRFTGWSGACSGTAACVLDMDLGPHGVEAQFTLDAELLFRDGFE